MLNKICTHKALSSLVYTWQTHTHAHTLLVPAESHKLSESLCWKFAIAVKFSVLPTLGTNLQLQLQFLFQLLLVTQSVRRAQPKKMWPLPPDSLPAFHCHLLLFQHCLMPSFSVLKCLAALNHDDEEEEEHGTLCSQGCLVGLFAALSNASPSFFYFCVHRKLAAYPPVACSVFFFLCISLVIKL